MYSDCGIKDSRNSTGGRELLDVGLQAPLWNGNCKYNWFPGADGDLRPVYENEDRGFFHWKWVVGVEIWGCPLGVCWCNAFALIPQQMGRYVQNLASLRVVKPEESSYARNTLTLDIPQITMIRGFGNCGMMGFSISWFILTVNRLLFFVIEIGCVVGNSRV